MLLQFKMYTRIPSNSQIFDSQEWCQSKLVWNSFRKTLEGCDRGGFTKKIGKLSFEIFFMESYLFILEMTTEGNKVNP